MFTQLIGRIGSAAVAFAKYRISSLGVRKFMVEVAGIYAIDEIVDIAKPYSKWVEENEDAIVLCLSLGYMTKNSLSALFNRVGITSKSRILFSKIALVNPVAKIGPFVKAYSVVASQNGVKIMKGGAEILSIAKNGSKIALNHSGAPAVSAVLAAGLGGALPSTRDEWEATGGQLAAQLGDMDYSLTEAQLRSRLHEFSPVTLLRAGHRIVDSFLKEAEGFSEEKATAMLMEAVSRVDTVAGNHSIDGFLDPEDNVFIRIDGTHFVLQENRNTSVLLPGVPAAGLKRPLPLERQGIVAILAKSLRQVKADNSLTFMRVNQTERFVSTPFTSGRFALAIVLDLANPIPTFVFSEDSLIDDAQENLNDDLDEQAAETVVRWVEELPEFFGLSSESSKVLKEEADFSRKVRAVLPILGKSYRNGMITMDADALQVALGKFKPVLSPSL